MRYRVRLARATKQAVSHGVPRPVSRSTLADANESHDGRIFAKFAQVLIGIARPLHAQDPIGVDLDQSLYALDSTTIDLCLWLFPWAKLRRRKAAVKMHTLLDLHGNIPTFIRVTSGNVHDRRCARRKHPGRDRDRTKAAGPGGQSLSNATDSEPHALRENPDFMRLQTSEADAEFAESVNQLILFDT